MALYDIYDVFCFTSGDIAVGNAFDFNAATLIDPVTIDTTELYGSPRIFTGTSATDFNGSDATFLGLMAMDVTMTDGTVKSLQGNYVETADGNTYVVFNDSAGDFTVTSGVVTAIGQPRENILTAGPANNNQQAGTPPCFTPNSLITTDLGVVPIHQLNVGDRVLTRDNGFQPVKWIYDRKVSANWMTAKPQLLPVVIQKDALGPNLPERDMHVSAEHLIMLKNCTQGEGSEVLLPARQLVNRDRVYRAKPYNTSYVHLLFDAHQVIMVDGIWSESFQPGAAQLSVIGAPARSEILELFPETITQEYAAARPVLYRRDARAYVQSVTSQRLVQ